MGHFFFSLPHYPILCDLLHIEVPVVSKWYSSFITELLPTTIPSVVELLCGGHLIHFLHAHTQTLSFRTVHKIRSQLLPPSHDPPSLGVYTCQVECRVPLLRCHVHSSQQKSHLESQFRPSFIYSLWVFSCLRKNRMTISPITSKCTVFMRYPRS